MHCAFHQEVRDSKGTTRHSSLQTQISHIWAPWKDYWCDHKAAILVLEKEQQMEQVVNYKEEKRSLETAMNCLETMTWILFYIQIPEKVIKQVLFKHF